jgi:hypothetical protein
MNSNNGTTVKANAYEAKRQRVEAKVAVMEAKLNSVVDAALVIETFRSERAERQRNQRRAQRLK